MCLSCQKHNQSVSCLFRPRSSKIREKYLSIYLLDISQNNSRNICACLSCQKHNQSVSCLFRPIYLINVSENFKKMWKKYISIYLLDISQNKSRNICVCLSCQKHNQSISCRFRPISSKMGAIYIYQFISLTELFLSMVRQSAQMKTKVCEGFNRRVSSYAGTGSSKIHKTPYICELAVCP